MSWIGLRDPQRGFFNEAGLGKASTKPVDLNGLLPKGSLMLSFAVNADMTGRNTTLVRQMSNNPWISGIEILLAKDGSIVLRHTQGQTICSARLPAGLVTRMGDLLLTYTWDAPSRFAMLSLQNGETGQTHFVRVKSPQPLSLRDAIKLTRHPGGCTLNESCDFLAVADHMVPHGPLPALCGSSLIPTLSGLARVDTLKQGDLILADDGGIAQVRWLGTETVPCRGRFAKTRARAPFFGATRDLTGSAHQRIELIGSEVDYLFANARVSVRLGDLPEHVMAPVKSNKMTETYYGLLLDRTVGIKSGGLSISMMDVSELNANDDLRKSSVLRDLPAEMMPKASASKLPLLRRLETLTLLQLMAA